MYSLLHCCQFANPWCQQCHPYHLIILVLTDTQDKFPTIQSPEKKRFFLKAIAMGGVLQISFCMIIIFIQRVGETNSAEKDSITALFYDVFIWCFLLTQ